MTLDTTNPIIISINAYTPDGWNVKVSINADSFMDSEHPYAVQLDTWLAAHSFQQSLPGLEPGEDKATIAFVIRRNHKNKDTGEVTPQIAFYADGGLDFKYAHLYMNTPDDIHQFEAQTGLQLDKLPVWEANQFPSKSDDSFQKYAVKVANVFEMVKKQVGTLDNNMPRNEYRYFAPVQVASNVETGTQRAEWPTLPLIGELVRTFNEKNNTHIEPVHFAQMAGIENRSNISEWGKKYKTGKDAYQAVLTAYQDGALTRIQDAELSGMDAIEAAAESATPK